MNTERIKLLKDLIAFIKPLNETLEGLAKFPWDSEELVVLTFADVRSVLTLFLEDKLSAAEMETWANAIEGREDIGLEPESLKEIIFHIANPEINNPLEKDWVQEMIIKFDKPQNISAKNLDAVDENV